MENVGNIILIKWRGIPLIYGMTDFMNMFKYRQCIQGVPKHTMQCLIHNLH